MRSSRLDITQEKMHSSTASIEFFWEETTSCEDEPTLKAISMTSLDISQSIRGEEEDETARVRFSANIDCRPCLHIHDYTLKESKACFYTSEERKQMAASREDIIDKIDQGTNEEAEDEILRGLEYWCIETTRSIDKRVDAVIQLIMDEQDDQIDKNILDEYALSVAAHKVTSKSAKVARQIAVEDARLAQEAYLDMAHNNSIASYMMPATLCTFELNQEEPRKAKRRRSSKRKSKVNAAAALAAAEAAVASSEMTPSEEFTVPKKTKKVVTPSADTDDISPSEEFTVPKKTKKNVTSSVDMDDVSPSEEFTVPKKSKKEKKASSSTESTKKRRSSTTLLKSKKDNADDEEKSTKSSKSSSSSKSSKTSKKKKTKTIKSSKKEKKQADADKDTLTTEEEPTTNGSLSSEEGDNFLSKTTKKKKKIMPTRRYTVSALPSITMEEEEEQTERPGLQRGFSWWTLKA